MSLRKAAWPHILCVTSDNAYFEREHKPSRIRFLSDDGFVKEYELKDERDDHENAAGHVRAVSILSHRGKGSVGILTAAAFEPRPRRQSAENITRTTAVLPPL